MESEGQFQLVQESLLKVEKSSPPGARWSQAALQVRSMRRKIMPISGSIKACLSVVIDGL
jgi:hypothetical protein